MINRIGVGVIGLGVGLHHVNTLISNNRIDLIGVCDFDNLILKSLKKISKN